jgi:hypothetical protein
MKGQYTGFYKYDNERVQQKLSRDQTFFDIDVTEVNGEKFFGTLKEEAVGQPGLGSIIGELSGDTISFIKQMNVAAGIKSDGQLKTYNTRHPKIYYKGIYEKEKFVGSWKIKFGFIFVGLLPIPIPPISGTWEMRKK